MKKASLFFLFVLTLSLGCAQEFLTSSDTINKRRFIGVSAAGLGVGLGSILALNYVWYDQFDQSSFHFFDDSHEWGQMDKLGHSYSAFHFTTMVSDFYQWAGVKQKKAALMGGAYSFIYMSSFEVLDGYSNEWGFSWSDIGFNLIGISGSALQTLCWDERLINLKFSVHNSGLSHYRPNVLGSDFTSRTLKDYNGQTYWLSLNPLNWGKKERKIPAWINLSMGYSINNQLIGDGGTYVYSSGSNQLIFSPYRQFFLSLDIDFEKIETDSRLLKVILRGLNCLKVPFPTLEYSQGKLSFHPLYF